MEKKIEFEPPSYCPICTAEKFNIEKITGSVDPVYSLIVGYKDKPTYVGYRCRLCGHQGIAIGKSDDIEAMKKASIDFFPMTWRNY